MTILAWFLAACSTAPAPVSPAVAAPAPRTRPFADGEDHAPAPATSGPRVDKRRHREFETPAAAEVFLDGVVADLLEDPLLGIDPGEVAHGCTDDGRHCTFEGPWREDLQVRWIQAVAGQRTSLDALEGVTITAFRPRDADGGGKRFVLEAHAP